MSNPGLMKIEWTEQTKPTSDGQSGSIALAWCISRIARSFWFWLHAYNRE